jgi:hypothetical protein
VGIRGGLDDVETEISMTYNLHPVKGQVQTALSPSCTTRACFNEVPITCRK